MTIPENYFLYINVFISLIYIALMIIGFKKGFIFEAVSLIYTAVSLAIAYFSAPVLAAKYPILDVTNLNDELDLFGKFVDINPIINAILYFLIVFIILKIVYIVLSLILKGFNKIPVLGGINRIFGALFGILNATLITLAISMLFTLPIFKNGKQIRENTILKVVDQYSKQGINYLVDNINLDKLSDKIANFDVDKARESFKNLIEEYE